MKEKTQLFIWALNFIVTTLVFVLGYLLLKCKASEKRKNKYFDKVIHTLKTPITTINLAVSSLSENEFATIIKTECNRMNEILINLHKFLIHDKLPKFDLQVIDVHEALRECFQIMASVRTLYDGAIHSSLNAKNFMIMGEKEELSSVFLNIMDNAMKYCEKPPEMEIVTVSNDKEILISFKDNGIGVKRKYRRRVFRKSFRISNKDDVEGFGMGLYYAKNIILEHKGKIKVSNNPGGGTIFNISLPLYNF